MMEGEGETLPVEGETREVEELLMGLGEAQVLLYPGEPARECDLDKNSFCKTIILVFLESFAIFMLMNLEFKR